MKWSRPTSQLARRDALVAKEGYQVYQRHAVIPVSISRDSLIFVAGHGGLVGLRSSAALRGTATATCSCARTRSWTLREQAAVSAFLQETPARGT